MSSVSPISGYAFAVKDLDKAKQLGIGGLWSAISSVQNGNENDTVEIANKCKGKAQELNKSLTGNLFEAVRIYVKLKFNQLFGAIYDKTLGQLQKFGQGLAEKLGSSEALKSGLDGLGAQLDGAVQKQVDKVAGVTDEGVSDAVVEQELNR